jgi:hypothetical protein
VVKHGVPFGGTPILTGGNKIIIFYYYFIIIMFILFTIMPFQFSINRKGIHNLIHSKISSSSSKPLSFFESCILLFQERVILYFPCIERSEKSCNIPSIIVKSFYKFARGCFPHIEGFTTLN